MKSMLKVVAVFTLINVAFLFIFWAGGGEIARSFSFSLTVFFGFIAGAIFGVAAFAADREINGTPVKKESKYYCTCPKTQLDPDCPVCSIYSGEGRA